MLVLFASAPLRAATNTVTDEIGIPPLRGPKPEILPGFWEQHGLGVALAGLCLVVVGLLLWRILWRPKPPILPTPAEVARRELAPLKPHREDAALWTEVSLILRRYFVAALGLPTEEFTNSELCRELEEHPAIGSDLAADITPLLQSMDHRRFNAEEPSTNVEPQPTGREAEDVADEATVEQALTLIDRVEKQLQPTPAAPATSQA